jgi:hypothetical protein
VRHLRRQGRELDRLDHGGRADERVEYVSPLKGEAFEATSSDGFGFPQDCGGRQYAWRGSGHVAGEFSSDGRSVSGREEWNYATASGDELRLFFEWKRTKR